MAEFGKGSVITWSCIIDVSICNQIGPPPHSTPLHSSNSLPSPRVRECGGLESRHKSISVYGWHDTGLCQ